ncbi:hypothetical protein L596_005621 [Steinernema carpocapsae]|uniref:Uncharacterized protein n=1 Tax=Steinernema carpocapsae TaxID=34508 RepID=A0A4U8V0U2_STECR|nr:hypothetical protein L596_005621 [Steinernema carpocapsae]
MRIFRVLEACGPCSTTNSLNQQPLPSAAMPTFLSHLLLISAVSIFIFITVARTPQRDTQVLPWRTFERWWWLQDGNARDGQRDGGETEPPTESEFAHWLLYGVERALFSICSVVSLRCFLGS